MFFVVTMSPYKVTIKIYFGNKMSISHLIWLELICVKRGRRTVIKMNYCETHNKK